MVKVERGAMVLQPPSFGTIKVRKWYETLVLHMPLNVVNMWVHIHDVPYGFSMEQVAQDVGNFIGVIIEEDQRNNDGTWSMYLRVRAKVNTDKPLVRRVRINQL